MIRDYYAAGKLDELCNEFLNDSLDEDPEEAWAFAKSSVLHINFLGPPRLHSPIQ